MGSVELRFPGDKTRRDQERKAQMVKNRVRAGASTIALGLLFVMAASPAQAQDAPNSEPADAADQADAEPETDASEILVTGSRLNSALSAPTPVAVVGAERLEQRGIANVA